MSDEEARLKALYQAAIADRPVGGEHPPITDLLRVVSGAGGRDTLGVMDHVMACAACRRDYDLLRAVTAATAGLRPTEDAAPMRRRWPVPAIAGVGALVATALVVAVLGRRPVADVMRGGPDTGAVRLIPPRGNVLVWRPVVGAVGYRVEVDDDSGGVVLQVSTHDTSVSATGLVRGRRYQWWVRAIAADGTRRVSTTTAFTAP